jgi:hypothetical protein
MYSNSYLLTFSIILVTIHDTILYYTILYYTIPGIYRLGGVMVSALVTGTTVHRFKPD